MKRLAALVGLLVLVLPSMVEACQQYRDIVHDRNGNVLAGVQITVTGAGQSEPATIYTDPGCETVSDNPISSGSTGEFFFYALDGLYDFQMAKSGYTFINPTNVSIFEPLGQHVVSLGNYTVPFDDICAPGVGAIDQIGANVKELVVNRAATCSESKTIPSTLTIRFEGQGTVTVNSPFTLTVNGPVKNAHGKDRWLGTGTYVFGAAAGPNPYGYVGLVTPTYASNVAIDAALGKIFVVTANDGTAFTVNAPTHGAIGQEIRITIKNTSGGALGTVTWNSSYKLAGAWTSPATGKNRSITFFYDGTSWFESGRSAADADN
jgi:hypothetical protein